MRNYPPITGISLADWSRRIEATRARYPLAFDGGARIDLGPAARPFVPERTIRRNSPVVDLTSIALAYLARPVSPMWPAQGAR